MRYAQIRNMDISNGRDIGVSLFTQGCNRHCRNCHNPEQWNFSGGTVYTKDTEQQIIDLLSNSYIERFSILGGEPIDYRNLYDLFRLCYRIKHELPHIKIWLYTGYTWEELQEQIESHYYNRYLSCLLENIDVMVDGPFIEDLKDITLAFRGSSNQKIINVQESLKENQIILYQI